jgi:hypothetical protein
MMIFSRLLLSVLLSLLLYFLVESKLHYDLMICPSSTDIDDSESSCLKRGEIEITTKASAISGYDDDVDDVTTRDSDAVKFVSTRSAVSNHKELFSDNKHVKAFLINKNQKLVSPVKIDFNEKSSSTSSSYLFDDKTGERYFYENLSIALNPKTRIPIGFSSTMMMTMTAKHDDNVLVFPTSTLSNPDVKKFDDVFCPPKVKLSISSPSVAYGPIYDAPKSLAEQSKEAADAAAAAEPGFIRKYVKCREFCLFLPVVGFTSRIRIVKFSRRRRWK